MKNFFLMAVIFIISFIFQYFTDLILQKEFISILLTVFSIFFGFYITSFAVFATSKYLSRLYKIENKDDNRKTLLDDLLGEFRVATYFLLSSIIYLIFLYILLENQSEIPLKYSLNFIWAFVILNIFYAFRTISIFIKITRQSAKYK